MLFWSSSTFISLDFHLFGNTLINHLLKLFRKKPKRLNIYLSISPPCVPGQWSCVTSHKQGEEMWRGRHCSMFSKTSLHTSHASDRSGAGLGILPHLTTLIIQDLVLVPGSGAGWTLFRKRHQRRNPQCRCAELLNRRGHNPDRCLSVYCPRRQRLQSLTSRQWINQV